MVLWWCSADYRSKRETGQAKRLLMGGGSHRQGSLSLATAMQREVSKCICLFLVFTSFFCSATTIIFILSILQEIKTGVRPSVFGFWKDKRTRTEPHPDTGSMWMNKGAEIWNDGYTAKLQQIHGPETDHVTYPFDPEAVVLEG
jgi:hypothetical protein